MPYPLPALTSVDWVVLLAAVVAVAFFDPSVSFAGRAGYRAPLSGRVGATRSARASGAMANICVAGIAWFRFWRAGHFDWRVLLSFAVASIPCAWLGAKVPIAPQTYKFVLGGVLTVAGLLLLFRSRWQTDEVAVRHFFLPA